MNEQEKQFLMNHLANIKLSLSVAAYSKVPLDWRDINFTPDFCRFYYIRKGEGYIKIGNEEFYPQPGHLVLLPSGMNQSYATINDNTFTKYWCHFNATIGDLNLFHVLKLPRLIEVTDSKFMVHEFQNLIKYRSSQELTSVLRVKSILIGLICYFIEHSEESQIQFSGSLGFEKLNSLLSYIDSRLHESITVDELAKLVHFHPNYFIHFFHKMTGYSPIQYINKQKMERAKQLLSETELTVTEVSDQVGCQLYYFSKMFKSHTGFSPTGFRGFMNQRV